MLAGLMSWVDDKVQRRQLHMTVSHKQLEAARLTIINAATPTPHMKARR